MRRRRWCAAVPCPASMHCALPSPCRHLPACGATWGLRWSEPRPQKLAAAPPRPLARFRPQRCRADQAAQRWQRAQQQRQQRQGEAPLRGCVAAMRCLCRQRRRSHRQTMPRRLSRAAQGSSRASCRRRQTLRCPSRCRPARRGALHSGTQRARAAGAGCGDERVAARARLPLPQALPFSAPASRPPPGQSRRPRPAMLLAARQGRAAWRRRRTLLAALAGQAAAWRCLLLAGLQPTACRSRPGGQQGLGGQLAVLPRGLHQG